MKYLKLDIQKFAISASNSNNGLKSTAGNKGTVAVSLTEQSYSVTDNTSTIKLVATYKQDTGSWAQIKTPRIEVWWCDDNAYTTATRMAYTEITAMDRYDTVTATATITVKHKNDGKLSGYAIGKWVYDGSSQWPCKSGSTQTGWTALTTIPRSCTITATNAYIGSTSTITFKGLYTGLTAKVTYVDNDGKAQTACSVSGDQDGTVTDTWTIPENFYYRIPSTSSGSVTLTVTTYSGSTAIGSTATTSITYSINSSAAGIKPVVELDAYDTSNIVDLTQNNKKIIYGLSSVYCAVTSLSVHPSTSIKSIVINGQNVGNNIISAYVNYPNVNRNTFTVVVTDERGNVGTDTISLTPVEYTNLTIAATVVRNKSRDGKVKLTVSGNWSETEFRTNYKNTLSINYKYKEKGSSSYTSGSIATSELTIDKTNKTYMITSPKILTGFDPEKSYIFEVTATDLLGTVPKSAVEYEVRKGDSPLYVGGDGNVYIKGKVYTANNTGTYSEVGGSELPVGSVYFNVDGKNPFLTLGYGTWERIAQGRYLLCEGTSTDGNGASRTITGGQTGGVWEHTHTISHTHTYSHTHGVPGVAHVHSVGAHKHAAGTLFAQISFSSSYLWNKYITTQKFKSNARKAVSGTSADSTQTPSDSTAVGGSTADSSAFNTGSTTPNAATTNSQSTSTTSGASTSTSGSTQGIPPYFVIYAWKRTA